MPVARIYVTGHRNPDTDSIAAAIGYAELKQRLDPRNDYVPVRLGDLNAQTRWVLERAEAPEPRFLPHVMLRVSDVMREHYPCAHDGDPIREVGLTMAREDLDIVPIVGEGGVLSGVMTERALARRYIRESREASRLEAPTALRAIVQVLDGELIEGRPEQELTGRVSVLAMSVDSMPIAFGAGDIVVVGDRPDAQKLAIETGVALMVTSNGTRPDDDVLALAREHGTAVIGSPLDTYVSGRMITLAEPARALMDREPLTVRPEDLVGEGTDLVKDVDYRAAVAVDAAPR